MKKIVSILMMFLLSITVFTGSVKATENQNEEVANKPEQEVLRYDPTLQAYRNMFNKYFSDGYFEKRSSGITLTLFPKMWNWSKEDTDNARMSVYASFYRSQYWDNTDTMRRQFYCHAKLIYRIIEKEWNLEPWRTSISDFTCN